MHLRYLLLLRLHLRCRLCHLYLKFEMHLRCLLLLLKFLKYHLSQKYLKF